MDGQNLDGFVRSPQAEGLWAQKIAINLFYFVFLIKSKESYPYIHTDRRASFTRRCSVGMWVTFLSLSCAAKTYPQVSFYTKALEKRVLLCNSFSCHFHGDFKEGALEQPVTCKCRG